MFLGIVQRIPFALTLLYGCYLRHALLYEGSLTMTDRMQYDEDDPRHHTLKLKQMLNDTAVHAREDVSKISDPKAQALFETTAEVLKGLVKAFDDFEEKRETAWKAASSI